MNSLRDTQFFFAGLGAGAGAMYFLDPVAGGRRRSLVRDQFVHASHLAKDQGDKALRDLSNRVGGLIASTQNRFGQKADPGDQVLEARIRSQLGRIVSHPSAINVRVEEGTAILSGPILAAEVAQVLKGINRVHGVKSVQNEFSVHETAENIPALQGGEVRKHRPELLQKNWAPGTRLVMGSLGLMLLGWGNKRNLPLSGIGSLFFLRAFMNRPFNEFVSSKNNRQLAKAEEIAA